MLPANIIPAWPAILSCIDIYNSYICYLLYIPLNQVSQFRSQPPQHQNFKPKIKTVEKPTFFQPFFDVIFNPVYCYIPYSYKGGMIYILPKPAQPRQPPICSTPTPLPIFNPPKTLVNFTKNFPISFDTTFERFHHTIPKPQ